eukprot:9179975-Ditylum_brightwellii.AAC.1
MCSRVHQGQGRMQPRPLIALNCRRRTGGWRRGPGLIWTEPNCIQVDLSTVIDRWLNLSVFVPNSVISSDEAMHILNGLNTLDK